MSAFLRPAFVAVAGLVTSISIAAQTTAPPRAEVELPLSAYDALRAATKQKKEERAERAPFGATRLTRGALVVDLEKRRASWEAEFDVTAGGDEPPAVPLLLSAAPVGRWAVNPETARIESTAEGSRLIPERAGVFRASL